MKVLAMIEFGKVGSEDCLLLYQNSWLSFLTIAVGMTTTTIAPSCYLSTKRLVSEDCLLLYQNSWLGFLTIAVGMTTTTIAPSCYLSTKRFVTAQDATSRVQWHKTLHYTVIVAQDATLSRILAQDATIPRWQWHKTLHCRQWHKTLHCPILWHKTLHSIILEVKMFFT
jgi:hypothetical protein